MTTSWRPGKKESPFRYTTTLLAAMVCSQLETQSCCQATKAGLGAVPVRGGGLPSHSGMQGEPKQEHLSTFRLSFSLPLQGPHQSRGCNHYIQRRCWGSVRGSGRDHTEIQMAQYGAEGGLLSISLSPHSPRAELKGGSALGIISQGWLVCSQPFLTTGSK